MNRQGLSSLVLSVAENDSVLIEFLSFGKSTIQKYVDRQIQVTLVNREI